MGGKTKLLEVIRALSSARGLTRGLHGGEQKSDQHADDRDHDQEFDESEARPARSKQFPGHGSVL
jgi:hypothetical protein